MFLFEDISGDMIDNIITLKRTSAKPVIYLYSDSGASLNLSIIQDVSAIAHSEEEEEEDV